MVGPRNDGKLGAGNQPKHLHHVLRTNTVAIAEGYQDTVDRLEIVPGKAFELHARLF